MGGSLEDDDVVRVGNRTVEAAAFPIGIDAWEFAQAVHSPRATEAYERLKASVEGKKTIIGVDRLDYSKGLPERFAGYRRFLEEHDECRGKVTFLQIAPRRAARSTPMRRSAPISTSCPGRINGEFAAIDWVPIRYVNQGYPREELAGFYRASDMALITPLRDGMNLVAKEYVAAQDPKDPGVLILSRFAGAAWQFRTPCWSIPTARTRSATPSPGRRRCRAPSASGAGGR